MSEGDSLAPAEPPARPTGVDEPDLGAVPAQAVPKHLRVPGWRQGQERGGETGAERGLGIGYASLGAGNLCRVAREEVIQRLLGRQARERRQDAERVAGKEYNRVGMPAAAGQLAVRDEIDRVRGSRIL